jgi:hypothetical protein
MEDQNISNNKVDRILNILEKEYNKKWIETISTILLSAATVLSAWCVYQSSQWSGEQYFRIDDETAANQFRLQYEVAGAQRKSAELQLFLEYSSAVADSNFTLAEFLYNRFPRSFKEPFDTWMKLDPFKNPDAPSSPFTMKEYSIPELEEAKKYEEQAKSFKKAANESDNHSDNYVLLSLVLSMVLFFSGMSGVAESKKNQRILLGTASVIFVVALIFIVTMPVVF